MSVVTQITSLTGDILSGVPPFATIFRGLLSVVNPFGGLAGKTVSIQIKSASGAWTDTGLTGLTDNNGVFYATMVWDPAFMKPGSYQIRAHFAGDSTNAACDSFQTITVVMSSPTDWLLIGGIAAVGLFAVVLLVRRRRK